MATSFSGGLCLPVADAGANKPFERVMPSGTVTIPLKQHIGGSCAAKVKKGEDVKAGQAIGEGTGADSPPVHASVSGKVLDITTNYILPSGEGVPAIIIDPDGKDEWAEKLSGADPLAVIQAAGIVDCDVKAVPLAAKLEEAKSKRVNSLIINGMDLEPAMCSRSRLVCEKAQDIARGAEIIAKIIGAGSVYLAIDKDCQQSVSSAGSCGGAIKVTHLKAKYPQAVDLLLVKSILGKEVPCKETSCTADAGALVVGAETALAVSMAVQDGKPAVDRFITIAGMNGASTKNVQVRIGTPIKEILGNCGLSVNGKGKVIAGGPLMGAALASADMPVTKDTVGIFVQHEEQVIKTDSAVCIKCGFCVDACPMGLMPFLVSGLSESGNYAMAEGYDIFTCIECGCCAYVCPLKLPMVQWIKFGKAQIMAQRSSQ